MEIMRAESFTALWSVVESRTGRWKFRDDIGENRNRMKFTF